MSTAQCRTVASLTMRSRAHRVGKSHIRHCSYTGSVTGTLSGLVMTGTSTTDQTGHDATDPSCLWQMETSRPITYYFSRDGTVAIRQGPGQWRMTHSGSCSGTDSGK